ncbi:hypothetical protein RhiirA1_520748 [Rhizophagus irregularis]|uniref:Uncharacterized protein n=4 Tax=Rhizophagus irregularis TaxID=588596 RepID=A0A2I1EN32_9GLOM|nr:hypothetical protein RirG_144930 [Rhizophagus irregularis DAOM 197198w]PKC62885.1 hypothetical protein RhiirA1_520748 [Rhizophagus irregularis]GBC45293.1 hypothetical protein GLOIN_2v1549294 [Rhizophagus irregularis DAOM 181602=DAOM 197198]PKY23541.1 hypothetical protein RhiirB3_437778 [Rhizophagus irregularis]UZO06914.1 hypothetical protein OCT59_027219 [Rhizophagus irregularis]
MSVEVISSEKTVQNRQASESQKILAQIEEAVRGKQGQQVVEVHFPDGKLNNLGVCQMIHLYYNAEIVNCDRLIIKYDGGHKEIIHRRLSNVCEAHNGNWFAASNVICMIGNDQRRPDAGAWFQWPSYDELHVPIKNCCIPPDLWFEVFYNKDPDRENALEKIDMVQRDLDGIFNIEFVAITLPDGRYPFRGNPNPGAISILANQTGQNTRLYLAPYLIHWNANNIPVYYIISWNHYIVFRCGVILHFNIILDIISRP